MLKASLHFPARINNLLVQEYSKSCRFLWGLQFLQSVQNRIDQTFFATKTICTGHSVPMYLMTFISSILSISTFLSSLVLVPALQPEQQVGQTSGNVRFIWCFLRLLYLNWHVTWSRIQGSYSRSSLYDMRMILLCPLPFSNHVWIDCNISVPLPYSFLSQFIILQSHYSLPLQSLFLLSGPCCLVSQ